MIELLGYERHPCHVLGDVVHSHFSSCTLHKPTATRGNNRGYERIASCLRARAVSIEYVWVQYGKIYWLRLITSNFAQLAGCEALIRFAFFKTSIHMIFSQIPLHSCDTQSSFDPFQCVMHMVILKTKCPNISVFSCQLGVAIGFPRW